MRIISSILISIVIVASIWAYFSWGAYSFRSDFEAQINYVPNADILHQEPAQLNIHPKVFDKDGHQYEAVAEFAVEALILSKKHYSGDDMASFSPVDLALGWGRMAEPERILEFSWFRQGSRYFAYRWEQNAPLDPSEIIKSASNIHIVPADEQIEEELENFKRGDFIRLEGHLVNVTRLESGMKWNTSTTRFDQRRGACEILYVTYVERL